MIYFDNAATSFPKPEEVYNEMLKCMKEYCANPGRGGHRLSILAGKAVTEARAAVCGIFNIKDLLRVSFTKNATEALNIALKGFLKRGDHVVTTCMEHNSVIRPLKTMERDMGIEITIAGANSFGEIDVEDIGRSIKANTKLIVCTFSSNVNGVIMPVKEIGELARKNGIAFLVDASQGAGTIPIDIEKLNIDMLAFPGHKGLLGPQGTGGLYVREGIELCPVLEGGTGSNSENLYQPEFMPDLLESGTLNTPGIVGLAQGISFINSFGIENIEYRKRMLTERLVSSVEQIKGIRLYSRKEPERNSGIVALNVKGMESTEVSSLLDKKYGIATRAGLHCAPLAHKTLGTLETGVVRLSFGCFNTADEIDFTVNALEEITYGQRR